MKKLLFFIVFNVFSLHLFAQEVILSDTLTYDSIQYHYELSEHILKPNRETLSIKRIISYDSANDVAGQKEVFHSLIKYKDSYKEKKSVHIKIFFAERVMGEWRPDVRNSMETIFHFRHKKVTYKGHGEHMQIGHKKLHLKKTDFDTKEIKRTDMFKIAVEQFIIHYSSFFLSN